MGPNVFRPMWNSGGGSLRPGCAQRSADFAGGRQEKRCRMEPRRPGHGGSGRRHRLEHGSFFGPGSSDRQGWRRVPRSPGGCQRDTGHTVYDRFQDRDQDRAGWISRHRPEIARSAARSEARPDLVPRRRQRGTGLGGDRDRARPAGARVELAEGTGRTAGGFHGDSER
jgi:hypothetical protein